MKTLKKLCAWAVSLMLGAFASVANAGDVYWAGGAEGAWAEASNWSGGALPTIDDTVHISSPATITVTSAATAALLDVTADVTLVGQIGIDKVTKTSIGDGVTLTVNATVGSEFDLKHVKGGTLRKLGPKWLRLRNDDYCSEDTTILLEEGYLQYHNGKGDPKIKNTTIVISEGGDLRNYGWLELYGTLTIENNHDVEVFINDGGRTAAINGHDNPAIIKRGTGALTFSAHTGSIPVTAEAGRFYLGTLRDAEVTGVFTGAGGFGVNLPNASSSVKVGGAWWGSTGGSNFTGGFHIVRGVAYTRDTTLICANTGTLSKMPNVYVYPEGTLKYNGAADKSAHIFTAGTLESSADTSTGSRSTPDITLTGDTTAQGYGFGLVAPGFGATTLTLDEHTFNIAMREGKRFYLYNTTVPGAGTINLTSGTLYVRNGDLRMPNASLIVGDNAKLELNNGVVTKDLTFGSGVTYVGTASPITVSGVLKVSDPNTPPENLIVTSTTVFGFPKGHQPESPFVFAKTSMTGLESGTYENRTIYVGDIAYPATITVDAENKSVSYVVKANGQTIDLDVGTERDLSAYPAVMDGTVRYTIDEILGEDGVITLTGANADSAFIVRRLDGTTLSGKDVKVTTTAGGETQVTFEPTVDGTNVVWARFGFNGTVSGEGKGAFTMMFDGNANFTGPKYSGEDGDENRAVHIAASPHSPDNQLTAPENCTLLFYATAPAKENTILASIGTCAGGTIDLVTGENAGQMKVVRTVGNTRHEVLAEMSVVNATSSFHLYAITREGNTLKIYLDGRMVRTYTDTNAINVGLGMQIGSIHGGLGNSGLNKFLASDFPEGDPRILSTQLDEFRIYDLALGPNAMKALAREFPFLSDTDTYERQFEESGYWVSAETWEKHSSEGVSNVDEPAAGADVYLEANPEMTIAINVTEDRVFSSLTLVGEDMLLSKLPGCGKISSCETVIDCQLTIQAGAADISSGPVTLGETGTIVFDYSNYDIAHTEIPAVIPLTGAMTRADQCVTCKLPDRKTTDYNHRVATFSYDEAASAYVLKITGDREPGELIWRGGNSIITEDSHYVDANGNDTIVLYRDDTVCVKELTDEPVEIMIANGGFKPTIRVERGTLRLIYPEDNRGYSEGQQVTIDAGGTLDVYGQPDLVFNLILNGGTLQNSGDSRSYSNYRQNPYITVTADSYIDAQHTFGSVASSFSLHYIYLNGHTLTKRGRSAFGIQNCLFAGGGKFVVEEGTLEFRGTHCSVYGNETLSFDVKAGATLGINVSYMPHDDNKRYMIQNEGTVVFDAKGMTIDDIKGSGKIKRGSEASEGSLYAPNAIKPAEGAMTWEVGVTSNQDFKFELGANPKRSVRLAVVTANTPEDTVNKLMAAKILVNGEEDPRYKVVKSANGVITASRPAFAIMIK